MKKQKTKYHRMNIYLGKEGSPSLLVLDAAAILRGLTPKKFVRYQRLANFEASGLLKSGRFDAEKVQALKEEATIKITEKYNALLSAGSSKDRALLELCREYDMVPSRLLYFLRIKTIRKKG